MTILYSTGTLRGWAWFAFVQVVALIAFVIGVFLLIPLAALKLWTTRDSRYFPGRTVTVWRGGWLMWVWGNDEDGVTGAEFYRSRFKSERWCAYRWSAWRNPANNLRFVFRWIGGPFWRWEDTSHTWFAQAGWNGSGFPVLSAGRIG